MSAATSRIALLLFGSGFCALVYQIAWLREFRLIFGASTAASAAVLAIFIGGLGAGGLLIGPRADRHPRPLALYATLETWIALSAALTPGLFWVARQAYVALGGTPALGGAGGTLLRLALAALVLALPTWLMGGTLPAAARAAVEEGEKRRSSVAALYGVNTLGAVAGAFVGTFMMLELFGTRRTLWLACLLNLLVATLARQLARTLPVPPDDAGVPEAEPGPAAPPAFVLAASGIVGFAFFLMELVWYRMLAPILGGSIFTFGLILSVALLGIGLGGWVYAHAGRDRPATLSGFATTCLLEAACIGVPYALGDRLAVLAMLLRPFASIGLFWGQVACWALVCAVVVLPAALVAGYQFPMLIALLGRGRRALGRQVGQTYACNTLGAILGSLAGGFGLIPYLSAPGAWRFTALLLVALGLAAALLGWRATSRRRTASLAALSAAIVMVLATSLGPTAAWRHSSIGVGRAPASFGGRNHLEDWLRMQRGMVEWEADGVESSVALVHGGAGLAFILNGKNDGNSRGDAPTMIMSGLLGALLHRNPRNGFIIGLGTGGTAGWMAAIPTVERVDVVELEPLVLRVAGDCTPVNRSVMTNPKVRVTIGDAREVLLVSRERYDIVFSEPSNPYRAGVASLFTREYYEAIARRLAPGGLFLQWVQGYEVDAQTIRAVYATLLQVFPEVETWKVGANDLMLVASLDPLEHDAERLRSRLREEPFQTGVRSAWRAEDLEGFLAWFVAPPALARGLVQKSAHLVNSDDRNLVEFGFARSVGSRGLFSINELRETALLLGADRPRIRGDVDWSRVDEARVAVHGPAFTASVVGRGVTPELKTLATAISLWQDGRHADGLAAWRQLDREPRTMFERGHLASALCSLGNESALPHIERIRAVQPLEADALLANLRFRQGRFDEAAELMARTLTAFRDDPWPDSELMRQTIDLAAELGVRRPELAGGLYESLSRPFVVQAREEARVSSLAAILGGMREISPRCLELIRSQEPHYPWLAQWLELRVRCYAATGDGRLAHARAELAAYLEREPKKFYGFLGLRPPDADASTTARRVGSAKPIP